MSNQMGLTVRRHERHSIRVNAMLYVSQESTGVVRFSPESDAAGGSFPVTLVDLGEGGMGFESRYFVPRKCVLHVKVIGEHGSVAKPMLDAEVRVQRVRMIDREPTYMIGTAFIDAGPALQREVKDLIKQFQDESESGEGRTDA